MSIGKHPPLPRLYAMLLMAAALWGGNTVAAKLIVQEMTPFTVAFFRFALFTLATLALIVYRSHRLVIPERRYLLPVAMLGVVGIFLNNLALFAGIGYTTAVNATLIIGSNPIFTCIFAYLRDRERLSRWAAAGIVISLAGTFLVVTKGSLAVVRNLSFNPGDLIILAMPITWSLYTVYGKDIMRELPALDVTAYSALVGTLCFLPWAYVESGLSGLGHLSPAGWGELLFMAFGSGVLAFAWWNYAVPHVGANRAVIFTNATPAAGVCLAWLLLGETLAWPQVVGFMAIATGIKLSTSGKAVSPSVGTAGVPAACRAK